MIVFIITLGVILFFIFRSEIEYLLYICCVLSILFYVDYVFHAMYKASPVAITNVITYHGYHDPSINSIVTTGLIAFIATFSGVVPTIFGAFTVVTTFNIPKAIAIAITIVGSLLIAIAFFAATSKSFPVSNTLTEDIRGLIIGIISGVLPSAIICWQTMEGHEEYSWFLNISLAYTAFGSTCFSKADLTDADFTKATLLSTDFRNATLIRTCFRKTKKLVRLCVDSTYPQKAKVFQVLVEGTVHDKNFDCENLCRVYFKDANIVNGSFIDADLSDANLQSAELSGANLKDAILNRINFSEANLSEAVLEGAKLDNANLSGINFSRANLKSLNLNSLNLSNANVSDANLSNVQAIGTDFTGATFTGACIENWNINSVTNFTNVICDYIYLRQGQKERRPRDINKNFAPGEFTKLFQKIQETVDLIFTDGIDWNAFIFSLKELKTKYGEENLSVQTIEKKIGEVFLIRLEVSQDIDKSEIEHDAKKLYEWKLNLIEETYRTQLHVKDREIKDYQRQNTNLWEITKLMASRPIETIIDITAKAENKSMSESSKYNLSNAKFGGGFSGDLGTTSGGIFYDYSSNIDYSFKQNLADAAVEIQQLLSQLQNQGDNLQQAQQKVASDLARQTQNNPALKEKLTEWGKYVKDAAATGVIGEAAVAVLKLALGFAGIPIP